MINNSLRGSHWPSGMQKQVGIASNTFIPPIDSKAIYNSDFAPSLFHSNDEERAKLQRDALIKKSNAERNLRLDPNNTQLQLILAKLNIVFADPSNPKNEQLVNLKQICVKSLRENYFDAYPHYILYQIKLFERISYFRIDQVGASILSLRRSLAINPQPALTKEAFKNLSQRTPIKWRELLKENRIDQDLYNYFTAKFASFQKQDPFEGEEIPVEHLDKAPPGLIEQYPSLQRLRAQPKIAAVAAQALEEKKCERDPECKSLEPEPEDVKPLRASVILQKQPFPVQRLQISENDYFIGNNVTYVYNEVLRVGNFHHETHDSPPIIYYVNKKGEQVVIFNRNIPNDGLFYLRHAEFRKMKKEWDFVNNLTYEDIKKMQLEGIL